MDWEKLHKRPWVTMHGTIHFKKLSKPIQAKVRKYLQAGFIDLSMGATREVCNAIVEKYHLPLIEVQDYWGGQRTVFIPNSAPDEMKRRAEEAHIVEIAQVKLAGQKRGHDKDVDQRGTRYYFYKSKPNYTEIFASATKTPEYQEKLATIFADLERGTFDI